MADLDDELLALAGDDSGDEAERAPQSPPPKEISLSPPAVSHSPIPTIEKAEKTATPPTARRGTAQKKMNKANGGAKKRTHDVSDEEEGELFELPNPVRKKARLGAPTNVCRPRSAAVSTPRSLGSVAMEESSAESEAEPAAPVDDEDDDGPLYPLEGRFKNETDKARILALPEIQREEVFYQRETELLRRQQHLQLRQKLKEKERFESKNKRKAGAADLEDDTRRAVRPKTDKARALDELKRSRENKAKENLKRGPVRPARRSRSGSGLSSDKDAEGESEMEWDDRAHKLGPGRDQPPAQLADIERARLGRSRLAALCFYPGFEDMVSGCFARVNITQAGAPGPVYRMGMIKGLKEGKPYRMEGQNGKPFMTDMNLLCVIGREEKAFPFSYCSDSPFMDSEYEYWLKRMEAAAVRVPTKRSLEEKRQDYLKLRDRSWTNLEIDEKIKRQNKLAHLLQKTEPKVSLQPVETQGDKLAQLNELNRKRNREEVRAAQLAVEKKRIEEQKAAIKRFKEAEALKKAAAEKAATEAQEGLTVPKKDHDDLFSDISDISRTGTPVQGVVKKPKPVRETKNGIPTFTRPKTDDEIISSLDLGIDLEV